MNTNELNMSKLDMRKELVLDISKNKGIQVGQKAQVVLVLDRSGSMSDLYRSGAVQELVERILPVGMAFDDNQEIDVYIFHNSSIKCQSANTSNIAGYVRRHVEKHELGGTSYAPIINRIVNDFCGTIAPQPAQKGLLSRIFGGSSSDNPTKKEGAAFKYPVYVIFITDGENDDKSAAIEAITKASNYGIFFQFIGIGYEDFKFLKKMDELNGRFIDNANFFKEPDLSRTSDSQLYNLLMSEFPQWLKEAKSKNLIQ